MLYFFQTHPVVDFMGLSPFIWKTYISPWFDVKSFDDIRVTKEGNLAEFR